MIELQESKVVESKNMEPDYTKDDVILIDSPNAEVDDSIKLNFVPILEKKDVIRKSFGKHLRSIAEASQDAGSGIYFE